MRSNSEIIAENVATLIRDFASGNQTQFSKLTGVAQPFINRFVKGDIENTSIKTLDAISGPCGKDAVWLLTDHTKVQSADEWRNAIETISRVLQNVPADILEDLAHAGEMEFMAIRAIFKGVRNHEKKKAAKSKKEAG